MGEKLLLAVQVAGMAGSAAPGGVAAFDGPAPLEEQRVDVWQSLIPLIAASQVAAGFVQVAVGLEEYDVVPGGGQAVDEGGAVAAAAVGGVGDSGAEEAQKP